MKSLAKDNEFYSNTSLRRTTKCRLAQAGIPKKVASLKTEQISEKADKVYIHGE